MYYTKTFWSVVYLIVVYSDWKSMISSYMTRPSNRRLTIVTGFGVYLVINVRWLVLFRYYVYTCVEGLGLRFGVGIWVSLPLLNSRFV
jgi:hypothetical protein